MPVPFRVFVRGLAVIAALFALYGFLLRPDVPQFPLIIVSAAAVAWIGVSLDFRRARRYLGTTNQPKEYRMPTTTASGRTITFADSIDLDEDTNAVEDRYIFADDKTTAGYVTVFPSGNTAFTVKGQPTVKTGNRDFMDALMGLAAAL